MKRLRQIASLPRGERIHNHRTSSASLMGDGLAHSASGAFEGFEIFIKYLPHSTTEPQLSAFFGEAGTIVGAPRLLKDGKGACKGCGWITFEKREALDEALTWNGCAFGGRHLQISKGKAAHTGFRPSLQAAGTHTPAMLPEIVARLVQPSPDGVVVDATYGRGGHTRGMIAALSARGVCHAFDMDAEAVTDGKALAAEERRFTIHHAPFSRMAATLPHLAETPSGGGGGVAAILFDLGISSPQFDEAHRGFRPEADGPLDLRFDQSRGQTAHEFLSTAPRAEITRVLRSFGETSDGAAAQRVADAIVLARACAAEPPDPHPHGPL